MKFAIENHTIFLGLGGSIAHGTSHAKSDVDLKGVCVAPLNVRLSLFESFEQGEGDLPKGLEARVLPQLQEHPEAARGLSQKLECTIFDIAKFLSLCASSNPNALEILFTDPTDWIIETPTWQTIYAVRHAFLTTRVQHSFVGYATGQLRRIQNHREELIKNGGPLDSRNAARAELERKFGYDTKHAAHLVRLLRMALEALETGELQVKRKDAHELRAIKDGAWSYEDLIDYAEKIGVAIKDAAVRSALPDQVERKFVDGLLLEIVEASHSRFDILRLQGPRNILDS